MTYSATISAKERLIVALDFSTREGAREIVQACGERVNFYKIGYQMIYKDHGIEFARELVTAGKRIFLDVKLHDIGNTVTQGIEGIADLGVDFVTVHGKPPTMDAAVKGRGNSGLKILAVTVMTSLDDDDLILAGYSDTIEQLVMRRAQQAVDAGVDGVICSAQEAAMLRGKFGDKLILVTPGIRPDFAGQDDQKRVVTPGEAFRNSVDHIVVGRPITAHDNPEQAAALIQKEIAQNVATG